MKKKEFFYKSADAKTNIHAVMWTPETKPIGIIQIAHGVTEYILRYEEFAEFFTKKGFVVVGNDHLGHGKSVADNGTKMYFGPKGSWKYVTEDIHKCLELTKNEYPSLPYYILGFSLGSFIVRTYLIQYPGTVDKAIIIGTGQTAPFKLHLAKIVAENEIKKIGEKNTSDKIRELTFGTYNKMFRPNKTDYDWLCSSTKSLEKYIKDPLRGGDFTAGLFREMISGMLYAGNLKNIEKMQMNLPILLLSGECDPVGEMGKGAKRVYKVFKKAGLSDVKLKLYPNLRHDILHEDICEEIFNDIYNWLER